MSDWFGDKFMPLFLAGAISTIAVLMVLGILHRATFSKAPGCVDSVSMILPGETAKCGEYQYSEIESRNGATYLLCICSITYRDKND